eukprot:scaffold242074_cov16-Prasinocladus_malaysianus.AAC.1
MVMFAGSVSPTTIMTWRPSGGELISRTSRRWCVGAPCQAAPESSGRGRGRSGGRGRGRDGGRDGGRSSGRGGGGKRQYHPLTNEE